MCYGTFVQESCIVDESFWKANGKKKPSTSLYNWLVVSLVYKDNSEDNDSDANCGKRKTSWCPNCKGHVHLTVVSDTSVMKIRYNAVFTCLSWFPKYS